jgi:glucosamine--fructose-6-phosphate aminotransferase (isomerizing)
MTALAETISTQSALLEDLLELEIAAAVATLGAAERIWLVGTGTSQHAAELGAQMIRLAGLDARPASSAAFARLRPRPEATDAVILISHTGETAFSRAVRHRALETGAPLVSITGEGVGWEEAVEVAPRERSETYTASYTAALLTLSRLAGGLGASEFSAEALSGTVAAVGEATAQSWATAQRPVRLLAIAGAGPDATTAREGALKIREAARIASEGFEAEYLLHGSAVPLGSDDQLLLLRPSLDPDGLLPALGKAAQAEGVAVSALDEPSQLDPLLAQIPLTVRLQLLASTLADDGGHDPDKAIEGAWADERLWELGA